MILDLHEREYRKLPELNYSKVKEFLSNPRGYYRKYILGESIEDEDKAQFSDAMLFGNVVDTLLTAEEDFDYCYQIMKVERPTGNLGKFCDALYKHTLANTVEGILQVELDTLYPLAYEDSETKKPLLPGMLEAFANNGGLEYYTSLRDKGDRLVISQRMYDKAMQLVEKLMAHPFSAPLLNKKGDDRWIVKNQLILTGKLRNTDIKGMLDKVIIDEQLKVVYPYDIKTTAAAELFGYNYRKMGYYLQLGMYTKLLEQNYLGYTVKPLSFLVVDQTMYQSPLFYMGSDKALEQSMAGFKFEGRLYKGLDRLIEEIEWATANNCFMHSMMADAAKGRLSVEIFDDILN